MGTSKLKHQHLVSSNLKSLEAIYNLAMIKLDRLQHIFYSTKLENGEKIHIDLVTSDAWIKSCSRRSKALIRKYLDGEDVIVGAAKKMLSASMLNHEFMPPSIEFHFHAGVPSKIKAILNRYNVKVIGEVEEFPELEIEDESSSDEDSFEEILPKESSNIANLDTCTMITLVSNLSNGHADYEFRQEHSKFLIHLDDMAIDERKCRVLPEIIGFIKHKELIAAQTAMDEFDRIIGLIGGDQEKNRSRILKKTVRIVPDLVSDRIVDLPNTARISERAKLAFGTGESNRAVTVSSNIGFIRAARQQNVFISVKEHRPRALSEKKEGDAVRLPPSSLSSDFEVDFFSQIFVD